MPLKIDLHTHILPENWPDLRERYGYGGWVRLEHFKPNCARMMIDDHAFREIGSNCWDPHKRIEECNHTNVHVQVLSTVPVMFSYWARPGDTLGLWGWRSPPTTFAKAWSASSACSSRIHSFKDRPRIA